MSLMQAVDAWKAWIIQFRPQYAIDVPIVPEPEQAFLLGNRWADYGVAILFALLFPVVRGRLRQHLYTPLGKRVLFQRQKLGAKLTDKQQERLKKWNESCWKMTVFSTLVAIALAVSYGEPWFRETRFYWQGCSHFPPCNLPVSKGVLLFYAVETGFYIQAIHFLLVHEVRRKDWLESLIHHIATVALLVYSYYVNFCRVGVMTLLVHDVSDIFLEAAKLARYARRQNLAVGLFVTFMAIWIVTRDIYFPFVVIRSTLTEPLIYAPKFNIQVEPHYTIFNSLLILLEVLHIYWTWLILKVAWRQVSQGEARDVREDDSDSDNED